MGCAASAVPSPSGTRPVRIVVLDLPLTNTERERQCEWAKTHNTVVVFTNRYHVLKPETYNHLAAGIYNIH